MRDFPLEIIQMIFVNLHNWEDLVNTVIPDSKNKDEDKEEAEKSRTWKRWCSNCLETHKGQAHRSSYDPWFRFDEPNDLPVSKWAVTRVCKAWLPLAQEVFLKHATVSGVDNIGKMIVWAKEHPELAATIETIKIRAIKPEWLPANQLLDFDYVKMFCEAVPWAQEAEEWGCERHFPIIKALPNAEAFLM